MKDHETNILISISKDSHRQKIARIIMINRTTNHIVKEKSLFRINIVTTINIKIIKTNMKVQIDELNKKIKIILKWRLKNRINSRTNKIKDLKEKTLQAVILHLLNQIHLLLIALLLLRAVPHLIKVQMKADKSKRFISKNKKKFIQTMPIIINQKIIIIHISTDYKKIKVKAIFR